jgi:abequosyltransferase
LIPRAVASCNATACFFGSERVLHRFVGVPVVILSVCIPTFSRREQVLETAALVCDQLPADSELVISDNGSADGTAEAVEAFAAAHPKQSVRLIKHAHNVGFDQNVLDVVSSARGDYCWLLGDDDVPRRGALRRICGELESRPDLAHMLLNHARFDAVTRTITKPRMVALTADLVPATASAYFFHRCPSRSYFRRLGTNVITLSANVVDRLKWLDTAADAASFIGSNMIHVFVITRMLAAGGKAKFIAEPQYDYVCNNHRPWSNDVWQDYRSNVYGWLRKLGYDPDLLATIETEEITHRTWRDVARAVRDRLLSRSRQ